VFPYDFIKQQFYHAGDKIKRNATLQEQFVVVEM